MLAGGTEARGVQIRLKQRPSKRRADLTRGREEQLRMSCVLRRRYLLGRLALSATCHFHKSAAPSVYREIARLPCSVSWLHCTILERKKHGLKSGCRLGKLGVTVSSGLFRYRAAAYFVAERYCLRRQNVSTLTAHIVAGDNIFRLSRHILSPVHNLWGRHISSPAPIYVDVHGT